MNIVNNLNDKLIEDNGKIKEEIQNVNSDLEKNKQQNLELTKTKDKYYKLLDDYKQLTGDCNILRDEKTSIQIEQKQLMYNYKISQEENIKLKHDLTQLKEKYNNIKLDMSNYSETINSICLTERTLDRTKHSFLKEDNSSFININEDKSNKNTFNKINEIKIFDNKPINTFFYNKTYYNTIKDNNTSMNTTRKACRKIPLSKKYLINNAHKQYKLKKQKEINQIGLYRKRFTQILILLLEKYFKTYLLKYIYIFINKLKKYKKLQIKSIKNRKNKLLVLWKE